MAFKFGLLVFVSAYICSTQALRSCICSKEDIPVCGSDGNNYINLCHLECAQYTTKKVITVVKQGPCDDPLPPIPGCFCHMNYSPVCGTDGKTYGNKCALDCEKKRNPGLNLKHDRPCVQNKLISWKVQLFGFDKISEKPCTLPINICKSFVTRNWNMGFKLGILIGTSLLLVPQPSTSMRACTSFQDLAEPCGCTLTKENFDPLCGSDGNTYLNTCFLHCRQTIGSGTLTLAYRGICSKENRCTCHADYRPVCGTNEITYSNECVLKCHMNKNPSLQLKHNGECGGNQKQRLRSRITKTCICNPATGPICATNGVSYANYCVMRCKAEANNDKTIQFSYWGMCSSQEDGPHDQATRKPSVVKIAPRLNTEDKQQACDCPMYAISYFTRCGSDRDLSSPNCFCVPKSQNTKYEDPCNSQRSRPEDDQLNSVGRNTCFCAAVHKPVCGSDRQTYANMCVLHCRAKKKPDIRFLQWGDCHDVR
nr:serine protease inhibitor dipetalogastin [Helicoverpa armigera]